MSVSQLAGYPLVVAGHQIPGAAEVIGAATRAGSLSRAVRAVLASRGAAWVGCATDIEGDGPPPDNLWRQPIALTEAQWSDYYHGHVLRTLAPLYVDAGTTVQFQHGWREAYREVNARVGDRVAALAAPDAAVWINDLHLQLVPGQLRVRRPDLRIGLYLHSGFPAAERFAQQPMRRRMLEGLLGADLIALPHARAATNLIDVAQDVAGARRDGESLRYGGRSIAVRVLPPSVDATQIALLATDSETTRATWQLRERLGNPRVLLLSVGAAAPAEGVARRLEAFEQVLADGRLDPALTVLVHLSACGDEELDRYPAEQSRIDRQVARINGLHSVVGRPVVHYLRRELPLRELVTLYCAADVLLALPLRQAATLSVKEFIACRASNTGEIVLSEFSGTASELAGVAVVNPYDGDAVQDAIVRAARQARRPRALMAQLRHRLRSRDVGAWAYDFLSALSAAARHRHRVSTPAAAEVPV